MKLAVHGMLITALIATSGLNFVCGMTPRLTEQEFEHKVKQIEQECTCRGWDESLMRFQIAQLCEQQIFALSCHDLAPFITFGHRRMAIADALYQYHDLQQSFAHLTILKVNYPNFFSDRLPEKSLHDVAKNFHQALRENPEWVALHESVSLEEEFFNKLLWRDCDQVGRLHFSSIRRIPEMTLELDLTSVRALIFLQRYHELIVQWTEIFHDLGNNGVGMLAHFFAERWQHKKGDVEVCINECIQQEKVTLKMWKHIEDFLVLLIQPLHCDPDCIWF